MAQIFPRFFDDNWQKQFLKLFAHNPTILVFSCEENKWKTVVEQLCKELASENSQRKLQILTMAFRAGRDKGCMIQYKNILIKMLNGINATIYMSTQLAKVT